MAAAEPKRSWQPGPLVLGLALLLAPASHGVGLSQQRDQPGQGLAAPLPAGITGTPRHTLTIQIEDSVAPVGGRSASGNPLGPERVPVNCIADIPWPARSLHPLLLSGRRQLEGG